MQETHLYYDAHNHAILARQNFWNYSGYVHRTDVPCLITCHLRKHLSGWGMRARCLPLGEHSAAMPCGDPLGLQGYAIVGSFRSPAVQLQGSVSVWKHIVEINCVKTAVLVHIIRV